MIATYSYPYSNKSLNNQVPVAIPVAVPVYNSSTIPVYNTNNYFIPIKEEIEEIEEIEESENKQERNKFILKTFVYFGGLVVSNLIGIFSFMQLDINFIRDNYEVFEFFNIINLMILLYCSVIPICNYTVYTKSPSKYIHYFLFLESSSYLFGQLEYYFSRMSNNSSNLLLTSGAITASTLFTLTLYTLVTKTDFTSYIDYVFGMSFALIFSALLNSFFHNSIMQIFIVTSFCIVFCFYIMIDLQMITAKNHIMYKYSLNDYIFAAISLYLDVFNLFIYLLQCLILTND